MVETLSVLANVASIATAVVAAWAYLAYRSQIKRKRKRLEKYLETEYLNAIGSEDAGKRSVTHLMARVGMTEADVLEAAFSSSWIKSYISKDPETGHAATLLFRHEPLRGRP